MSDREYPTEELLKLADELESIRGGVDAFNPDARMAAYSAFDAAERVWKMVPQIIASLRSIAGKGC
jgi:hypothetical protein